MPHLRRRGMAYVHACARPRSVCLTPFTEGLWRAHHGGAPLPSRWTLFRGYGAEYGLFHCAEGHRGGFKRPVCDRCTAGLTDAVGEHVVGL